MTEVNLHTLKAGDIIKLANNNLIRVLAVINKPETMERYNVDFTADFLVIFEPTIDPCGELPPIEAVLYHKTGKPHHTVCGVHDIELSIMEIIHTK